MKKNKPFREYLCHSLKKTLLIMRIAVILLLIGFLQTHANDAYSQKTKLSVELTNTRLVDVLDQIENKSEFFFLYNEKLIDTNRKVSINAKDQGIEEVLKSLFKGTDVSYSIVDRKIILTPTESSTVMQQQKSVSGKVTDSSGSPLPGVSVVVKGTTNGIITDVNGNYSLSNVPERAYLQYSFIGMKSKEIIFDGKSIINIVMQAENIDIEEVVAVGYGTQKKTSLTAAVGTVKGEKLVFSPVAQVSSALSGRIAGLITAQNSGEIGKDNTTIKIRGLATTGNSNPLVIVDGVPRDFNNLDPNSVESLTVLKDAAAVAPYGMAGANGVILVTTKRGKSGKPSLSYTGYAGIQNPTTITEMMNSYDYAVMKNMAVKNQNPNAALPFSNADLEGFKKSVENATEADFDKYPNSNAVDFVRNKNVPINSHNLSLSGANDHVNYYMGLGYLGQKGMWSTISNERYNVILNLEAKPTKTTTVGLSINASKQQIKTPGADGATVFNNALDYLPTKAIYYSNGLLGNSNGKTVEALIRTGENYSNRIKAYTQLSIEQVIPFIKGLSVKGVYSYDPDIYYSKNWGEPAPTYYNIDTSVNPYGFSPIVSTSKPSLSESQNYGFANTGQFIINYNRVFGNHSVGALGVFEIRKNTGNAFFASRSNYDILIRELNMGNSDSKFWSNGGSSSEATQVGYVYRLTYAFMNKYLLEGAGRYDGHYFFAPDKKYGFFPSLSVGWRLSEEDFIKTNFQWIDNLKVRASWGESGNLAGSPFQYSSAMTIYGNAYVINGQIYQGINERLEPNPNITWEKAQKSDVGFDAQFWKGLLGVEFDYFYEKRNNMLVSPGSVVSAEYGIGIAQVNAGIIRNQGVDFSLTSFRKFSNGLKLDVNFNLTYAKNEIAEMFENPTTKNDPNRSRTGRAISTPFGLKAIGLFQAGDFNADGTLKSDIPNHTFSKVAPGDIRYADINNDGKINASDETALGYPTLPQIIYGFSPNIEYKGFNLSLLFQGSAQSSVFLAQQLAYPFLTGGNAAQILKDYWTPENTDAKFPRPFGDGGNANNFQRTYNSHYKYDGSYLRLKNIELGYQLPMSVVNYLKIQNARVYIAGQNLLTLSSLKNVIDPEMDNTIGLGGNARGWYYPQQKVLSVGLNLTF